MNTFLFVSNICVSAVAPVNTDCGTALWFRVPVMEVCLLGAPGAPVHSAVGASVRRVAAEAVTSPVQLTGAETVTGPCWTRPTARHPTAHVHAWNMLHA